MKWAAGTMALLLLLACTEIPSATLPPTTAPTYASAYSRSDTDAHLTSSTDANYRVHANS